MAKRRNSVALRNTSLWRVLRFALVSCAILAGAFVPSSAQAMTACEARLPTIEHIGLTEVTPAGAVFEAQINPQNSATTYEFRIVNEYSYPENPSNRGELPPRELRAVGGPIAAGAGDVTVSGLVTGLEFGTEYWYEVTASNLAGETRYGKDPAFSYYYNGTFPDGSPGAPFRSAPVSPCAVEEAEQEAGRFTAKAEAERHQQVREHEELLANESAVRYGSEAAALKRREEEEAAAKATGSVSLDGFVISVKNSGDAAVRLTCTGTATCAGRLTLTGKSTAKKGKKPKTKTIGTATFSIPEGNTATIEFTLNASGRALLGVDHGQLSDELTVLKSAPAPSQTLSDRVRLEKQKAHGKAKK